MVGDPSHWAMAPWPHGHLYAPINLGLFQHSIQFPFPKAPMDPQILAHQPVGQIIIQHISIVKSKESLSFS